MPKSAFTHIETWVFDLDNTLYAPEYGVFDQIDAKMTAFISDALSITAEAANALRAEYWRAFGTTLNGLMQVHDLPPEAFLESVHDIDLSHMPPDRTLGAALSALPGRKIVHTNGSRRHAENVLARLEIEDGFDAVYGIEDSDYEPKPAVEAYRRVAARAGYAPDTAAMFEDTARNLEAPYALGMRTVWRANDCPKASDGADGDHIDFVAHDLTDFLNRLTER